MVDPRRVKTTMPGKRTRGKNGSVIISGGQQAQNERDSPERDPSLNMQDI